MTEIRPNNRWSVGRFMGHLSYHFPLKLPTTVLFCHKDYNEINLNCKIDYLNFWGKKIKKKIEKNSSATV